MLHALRCVARTKVCCTDVVFVYVWMITVSALSCVAGKCDQLKKRAFFVDLPQEVITKEALEAAGECVCLYACVCVYACVHACTFITSSERAQLRDC